jgi:fatty acid synthase
MRNLIFYFLFHFRIFENGVDFAIEKLYPPIEYPVSRGTPSISPLIKWDHSKDHYITRFDSKKLNKIEWRRVFINISDPKYEYLSGHKIEGRVIFPAMGYVFLVWETLASMHIEKYTKFPVILEDVEFLHAILLENDVLNELNVSIDPKSGNFMIFHGTEKAAKGRITHIKENKLLDINPKETSELYPTLSSEDFYKQIRLRGFHHHSSFERVVEINGTTGKLRWDDNWVPFLDGILQIFALDSDKKDSFLIKSIQKITIDPKLHLEMIAKLESTNLVLDCLRSGGSIRCGGVEICTIDVTYLAKKRYPGQNIVRKYEFISHFPTSMLTLEQSAIFCVDVAIENNNLSNARIVEIDCNDAKRPLANPLLSALNAHPKIARELVYLTSRKLELDGVEVVDKTLSSYSDCLFIVTSNCLSDSDFLNKASKCLIKSGFIVSREPIEKNNVLLNSKKFQLIAVIRSHENESLVLLQLIKQEILIAPNIVQISNQENDTYEWLEKLKKLVKLGPVIVYSQNEPYSGILGFVNCVRKEPSFEEIQCVFIDDPKAPPFDINLPFYSKQLGLGLAVNVFRNGKWGSFRLLPMTLNCEAKPSAESLYAKVMTLGDLSSFKWIPRQGNKNEDSEKTISVTYVGLNFRDVISASGKIMLHENGKSDQVDAEELIGYEFSGVKKNGDRILGFLSSGGAFTTHINKEPSLIFDCPDSWTLEEAATVPCAYLTVYTAFFDVIRIRKEKSILIHAGCGGVGLAAIRVAFAYGLEVFTTVSTAEKKRYLLKEFPRLKQEYIGNSRDTSFEDMIMKNTNGKGVDYVLNSLTDEKLQASIRCLAEGGKFIEIGLSDIIQNNKLGMKFLKCRSFHNFVLLGHQHDDREELKVSIKDFYICEFVLLIISYVEQKYYPKLRY